MLFTLLTILFVALKLTGFIDWSWWFVLAPTLVQIIVFVTVIAATAAIGVRKLK